MAWESDNLRGTGLRPDQYQRHLNRCSRITHNRIKQARKGLPRTIDELTLILLQSTIPLERNH